MALYFETQAPRDLLSAFDAAIALPHGKPGSIDTWEKQVHSGAAYYIHREPRWAQAFFRPAIENGRLAFYIVDAQGQPLTRAVYSYYHGHMIETFSNHFQTRYTLSKATPSPVQGESATQRAA